MSPPLDDPPFRLTAAAVEAWLTAAEAQAQALYAHVQEPLYSAQREQAVREMCALLQEAMEEVRVMSASLREASRANHDKSRALLLRSVQLSARGARARQAAPSRPEAPGQTAEPPLQGAQPRHEAERRMLEMFMPERGQRPQPEER